MTRVAFLIRSLFSGGAERQLALLASYLDKSEFDVRVYTFYPGGRYVEELRYCGIPVISLGKTGRYDVVRFALSFARAVRRDRVDVVYSFLPEANIIAAVARPLHTARLVWGVRASGRERVDTTWVTRLILATEMAASPVPDLIVYNSSSGRAHHEAHGFARKAAVVPNGFDPAKFAPDASGGRALRDEWGIPPDALVVGIVGRISPVKDHATFLRAAALLSARIPKVYYVCVGEGAGEYPLELRSLCGQLGIARKVRWPGHIANVCAAYSAFDVNCLSSVSEGFPNVLGEAMLCGRPCVATNAGDAAQIIGDTGYVVPLRDSVALAARLEQVLTDPDRARLGLRVRARIQEHFGSDVLLRKTARLLSDLVGP